MTDGQIPSNTSQAQSNWFIFKKGRFIKKESTDLRTHDIVVQVSSTTAMRGDAVRVVSSVCIIAQSNTRNKKYELDGYRK